MYRQSALLDVSAAALNQYDQNDRKQDAGNNPDNRDAVHIDSSFLKDSLS